MVEPLLNNLYVFLVPEKEDTDKVVPGQSAHRQTKYTLSLFAPLIPTSNHTYENGYNPSEGFINNS